MTRTYKVYQKQYNTWVQVAGSAGTGEYLPLTGGTLTGDTDIRYGSEGANGILMTVSSDQESILFASSEENYVGAIDIHNDGAFEIKHKTATGVSYNNGQSITLFPDGATRITSTNADGTTEYSLYLTNTGGLRFKGNKVLTEGEALPLSGGSMTGDIYTKGLIAKQELALNRNGEASYLAIRGGLNSGANLELDGSEYASNPGAFYIEAKDNTNSCKLYGDPSGNLNWGGNKVLTEGNNTKLDGVSAGIGWGTEVTVTGQFNFNGSTGFVSDSEGLYPICCWSASPSIGGTKYVIDSYTYGNPSSLKIRCTTGSNQFKVIILR